MKDLLLRAAIAFFRDWVKNPKVARPDLWPDKQKSGIYHLEPPYVSRKGTHHERDYLVLRAPDSSILAVYRIRPATGILRRVFNYPLALNTEPAPGTRHYRKIKENKI